MYKSTSNFGNYMSRSASKSLRPKKTGSNEDLVHEPLRDCLDYKSDSFKDMQRQLADIDAKATNLKIEYVANQDKLIRLKELLTETLPKDKYHQLNCERGVFVKRGIAIVKEIKELKELRHKLGSREGFLKGTFSDLFREAARELLPHDVFEQIANTAKEMQKAQPNSEA